MGNVMDKKSDTQAAGGITGASGNLSRRGFLTVTCSGGLALAGLMLGGCDRSSRESLGSLSSHTTFDNQIEETPPPPEDTVEVVPNNQAADTVLSKLSLEQKVAQMFIVRPESITGVEVVSVAGDRTRESLQSWPVGGLVYFEQNLYDTDQTSTMLANTMQYALDSSGIPLFLCVDEEGGEVSRVGSNPGFGVNDVGYTVDIGASNDAAYAKSAASYIASYLKPLGFNLNFAPVCDIANNPYSDLMRWRSFGDNPDLVTRMARAQVEGFMESKLLCCAKHFPGIGYAYGDSHDESMLSERSTDEMRETEFVPFRSVIQAGVPFIMVGHLDVPNVTGDYIPASINYGVVQRLLREELGYGGLIITDALEMGAIRYYYSPEDSAVRAVNAGCDLILMPSDFEAAYYGVLDAVYSGEISEERINQSLRRILNTKLQAMGNLFRI